MPRIQTIHRRSVLLGLGRCTVPPRCAVAFEMTNPMPDDVYVTRVTLADNLGDHVSCALQLGDRHPLVGVSGRLLTDRSLSPLAQYDRLPELKSGARLVLLVNSHDQVYSLHVQPSVLLLFRVQEDEPDPVWKVEFPKILYGVQLPPTLKGATEPKPPGGNIFG